MLLIVSIGTGCEGWIRLQECLKKVGGKIMARKRVPATQGLSNDEVRLGQATLARIGAIRAIDCPYETLNYRRSQIQRPLNKVLRKQ